MTSPHENLLDDSVYCGHLSDVNKTNKVVSQEDIINEKGAIVVPKGKEITPQITTQLAQHKLAKPIDQTVGIENVLCSKTIFEELKTISDHQDVRKAVASNLATEMFVHELGILDKYPAIQQRLTVLKSQYFQIYRKAILGAFFAWLICVERDLSSDVSRSVIIGALTRDLGYLYINPEIVNKTGRLTAKEWRMLQGHVLVSFHILKMVPRMHKAAIRAVLEHHERIDGFGYPRGATQGKLSNEGQIVAYTDMFLAVFHKHVLHSANGVLSLASVLQVNSSLHGHENGEAALRIIKKFGSDPKPTHDNQSIATYLEKLKAARPLFNSLVEQLNQAHNLLKENTSNKIYEPSALCLDTLNNLLISSGLSHNSISDWVETLVAGKLDEAALMEVERYGMMMTEGAWRFNELLRYYREVMVSLAIESESLAALPNIINQAEKSFSKLSALLD